MALQRRHRPKPTTASFKTKPAVVQESFLIVFPFAVAFYQLCALDLFPIQRPLPLLPLLLLSLLTLLITSYRHVSKHVFYFRVPFTDSRGYRRADQADDALSLAIGLPLLVCSALFITSFSSHTISSPSTPSHLMDIWNRSPQFSSSLSSLHLLHFSHSDYLLSLLHARLDLLSFTILNLYSLLLDLALSIIAQSLHYLPINNSTRLVGSTIKSLLVSICFALAVRIGWWGSAISQSMTPFECLFSVFTFQSSLYLSTRLARRAFTLAESSIFSSTSVALMIEVIRLTSARLRYSSYLLKQQQHQHRQPISDHDRLSFLPRLFRFPTPAIAIQHVLVSGIFLMAFTLAPLLVLSRRLGQRPTKRHKPLTRSPSSIRSSQSPARAHHSHQIQKPIWTSEPTQSDYYSRFSNPDSQHQSRQYESALKENMRKIIALLIYASITWIGLVIMSHWLGWLFEIGRNRNNLQIQTWWRRILGPGWMAFFCYSFLDLSYSDQLDRDLSPISTERGLGANPTKISIRWIRVGMLAYWSICLMIGIGGWTGYLVQKRRSIRNRNLSLHDEHDLIKMVHDDLNDPRMTTGISWKSTLFNLRPLRRSRSFQGATSSISNPIRIFTDSILTDRSKKNESNHSIQSSSHPPESSSQTEQTLTQSQSLIDSTSSTTHTTLNQPMALSSVNNTLHLQGPNSNENSDSNWYWSRSNFLSYNQNRKLPKLVCRVKEFYNQYHGEICSEEKQPINRDKIHKIEEEGEEQVGRNKKQEGLSSTENNASPEKNIIIKQQQHQVNLRPTSPALLLPSASINSSTSSSVKKEQLNFKRKFFHILACLMFIPTIPLDIEFSSISFSVAFVIFTFCEFARYFAFYPIGAGIHLFFNEFIDSKDSGPVILSHFYLLTSCSTGIWLDGLPAITASRTINTHTTGFTSFSILKWISTLLKLIRINSSSLNRIKFAVSSTSCSNLTTRINSHLNLFNNNKCYHTFLTGCKIEDLIGILVLGFGDTFASVVGNRVGRIKWNRNSSKTVEGSIGFILSVILISSILVFIGVVQQFSFFKYIICLILISLLEAFTNQNDNLILPLYSWSILKLLL